MWFGAAILGPENLIGLQRSPLVRSPRGRTGELNKPMFFGRLYCDRNLGRSAVFCASRAATVTLLSVAPKPSVKRRREQARARPDQPIHRPA